MGFDGPLDLDGARSASATFQGRLRLVRASAMSGYDAFDHIDHVFCNVGGVIRYTFQVPGYEQEVNEIGNPIGRQLDCFLNAIVVIAVHGVHFVVREADLVGEIHVQMDEGVEAALKNTGPAPPSPSR